MSLFTDSTEHVSTGNLIIAIGDGISTEQIIRTLRCLYRGGIKCHGWETSEIVCGQSPARFVSCTRLRFTGLKLYGIEVIRSLREDDITYEAGLRWLLTSPTKHIPGKGPSIFVLPRDPIIKSGLPQALVFGPGTESPYIRLQGIDPEQTFPQGDILTARNIT